MSELMVTRNGWKCIHHRLLVTVSAAALLGFVVAEEALAREEAKPIVWIELGGQLDQLSDDQSVWAPDFASSTHAGPLSGTARSIQNPPKLGYDASAEIAFRPGADDWVFSVSAHFGRARRVAEVNKTAYILPSFRHTFAGGFGSHYVGSADSKEDHTIIDFRVGKDVGIGMLGASSTISAGLRIANLRSRRDVHISTNFPPTYLASVTNIVNSRISHDFRGIGPVIEWDGSVPLRGEPEDGQVGVDWGVNAALLFGRQRTMQSTDGSYRQRTRQSIPTYYGYYSYHRYVTATQQAHSQRTRRRNVTVPNLGGFIAASYRLPNVKVSLGYRADIYFNAMDGGVSAFKSEDRGFFGPYFNLSVGLGG